MGLILSLDNSIHSFNRVNVDFDADYQAILDYGTTQGYTLPSSAQQELQNQLVIDLKGAGVWSKLDTFAVFATDGDSDFALIDWKRLVDMTAVNSPTFTANQGYVSDDVSSYINSNYNPTTDKVNFSGNEASVFSYVFSSGSSINAYLIGNLQVRLFNLLTTSHRIHTTIGIDGADLSGTGFMFLNRSDSQTEEVYKNGALVTSASNVTSTGVVDNNDTWVLATPSFGGRYSDSTVSITGWGGSFNATDVSDFNTAITTYMSAI